MNVGIENILEAIDVQLLPKDVERSEKENFFPFIRNNQSRILLVLEGLDSLLAEVSHGEAKRRGGRERPLPAPDAFPITHALAFP